MKYLKKYNELNEGLIKSWTDSQLFKSIEDLVFKYKIGHEMGIYSGVYVFFDREELTKEFINDFYSLLNVSGFYITNYYIKDDDDYLIKSGIGTPKDEELFVEEDYIQFQLNKKFDETDYNYSRYLYHVTDNKYLDKIKKRGLVPHSRKKIEYHPDRVYMFVDKDDAYNFIDMLKNKDLGDDFSLITIDREKINYDVNLYEDPKFYLEAYYTYENIPPYSFIEIEKQK